MEIQRVSVFANLLTIGNGVCGFAALTILLRAELRPSEGPFTAEQVAPFAKACWLILLGMVFDVFDGRVARMSGASSTLGAQLDSLSDLITFGLTPAVMILKLGSTAAPAVVWWQRAVWFLSLAYFLGAMLRLARFTAEQDADEGEHLAFKGLPTPAAAGCVASLILFYAYIMTFKARELQWLSSFVAPEKVQESVAFIPSVLPVLGLVLGFTMVSNRLVFEHVGSRLFSKRHSFDVFVYLVFGAILLGIFPELVLPVLFLGYLVATPARHAIRHIARVRRPAAERTESTDA